MSKEEKIIKNVATLVAAGVNALREEGWSDEQISGVARFLADEAVIFLKNKSFN